MIINISAPNMGTPRYIRQVLNDLLRDLDSRTIIAGDFDTTLLIFDGSTRQKINRDIYDLNSDLEQVNSVNIYRILQHRSTEHTFFSVSHYIYFKSDHIIGSESLFSICIAFHRLKGNTGWLLFSSLIPSCLFCKAQLLA